MICISILKQTRREYIITKYKGIYIKEIKEGKYSASFHIKGHGVKSVGVFYSKEHAIKAVIEAKKQAEKNIEEIPGFKIFRRSNKKIPSSSEIIGIYVYLYGYNSKGEKVWRARYKLSSGDLVSCGTHESKEKAIEAAVEARNKAIEIENERLKEESRLELKRLHEKGIISNLYFNDHEKIEAIALKRGKKCNESKIYF